jgi:uncharacterized protein
MNLIVETSSDNAELWQGFAQGALRLPFCSDCGKAHLPPGPVCPFCLSDALEWRPACGDAVLSSWVVVREKHFKEFDPPYVVGEAQLAEGPRLTVLIDVQELANLKAGLAGRIELAVARNGLNLPHFIP